MSDHVKTALPTVEAENPERCGTCRFWKPISGGMAMVAFADTGACRRFPPTLLHSETADHLSEVTVFPCPSETDWCGEWQAERVPSEAETSEQELLDAVERVRYGEDTGCRVEDHDYRVLAAAYLRREHL